jgi:transcriptional regulator with XRE-family HTH domain
MAALPFCHVSLTARTPEAEARLQPPRTLGEHLIRRRRHLGLTQRQAGHSLKVCLATYASWESSQGSPSIRSFPRVYGFLGYVPAQNEPQALGDRLVAWRRSKGLSAAEVARMAGLDPGTVLRLEHHPDRALHGRIRKAVNRILATSR